MKSLKNEYLVFDRRICTLGEGVLWHPQRQQLFWFDILNKQLMSRNNHGPLVWSFDEYVSAAGWVDHNTLLIASETGLYRFNIETGKQTLLVALEHENPLTRSNDGRADSYGGFWISTMGKEAQPQAGTIYRFYQGRLKILFQPITIPNAICFAPSGQWAYYTDTITQQIMRQPLDQEGWPIGASEVFVDLHGQGLNPDGAVVDHEGHIWCALWGAGCIARYTPEGQWEQSIHLPATQLSCPAFGGEDLSRLFVTSATQGLDGTHAMDGQTFVVELATTGRGIPEHRVILDS